MTSTSQALAFRLTALWDHLFQGPPLVDTEDRFDGDSLELISGKNYRELIPLLSTELDCFPLFALISQEAGQYYLGSVLLDLLCGLQEVEDWTDAESLWQVQIQCFLGPWVSMMSFLQKAETTGWILGNQDLRQLVLDILRLTEQVLHPKLDEDDLAEIHQITAPLEAKP